ncbi:MAG: glycosyltransferase [Syntrophobacteraceae bacterium]|nr:glycosyltransferase [Syntrophobacteraceae bacterium]
MNDGPLVTFALFTYNQERFVREAVEGALSQTYSPLEIIFSDDCSSDRTFDIMREMASTYTGPHEIVLNRNGSNLGLGEHVNRVAEMARGELIVSAAGDDVSLPCRCEELVGFWQASGRKYKFIDSDFAAIDEYGREIKLLDSPTVVGPIDEMLRTRMRVRGCSESYTRDLFTLFGPILPDTVNEDRVIAFRSYLLGGIGNYSGVLVLYRLHDSNVSRHHGISSYTFLKESAWVDRTLLNVYLNNRRDLACAYSLGIIDKRTLDDALAAIEYHTELLCDEIKFLEGGLGLKISRITKHMVNEPAHAVRWTAILMCPSVYVAIRRKETSDQLIVHAKHVMARLYGAWRKARGAKERVKPGEELLKADNFTL